MNLVPLWDSFGRCLAQEGWHKIPKESGRGIQLKGTDRKVAVCLL